MSEQIDYRAEVLKVYPDAVCNYEFYARIDNYGYEVLAGGSVLAFGECGEFYSWQSAYETLKQQGKL